MSKLHGSAYFQTPSLGRDTVTPCPKSMHRIFFGPPRFPYAKSQDIPGERTRDGCIMLHPFVHQSRREKGPVNWIPMCLDLTSATLLHFTMHVFCGSKPATFGEPSKMTRLVLGAMFIIPIPDPGAQGVSARCREHLRTVGGLTPWSGLP